MTALKVKGQSIAKAPKSEEEFNLPRTPHGSTEFDLYVGTLDDSQKPFAHKLYMMQCEHVHFDVIATKQVDNAVVNYGRCYDCGALYRLGSSRTATLRNEWNGYCPDGYDMWDWLALLQSDKSLWPFIFDEVQYEMVEGMVS